MLSPKAGIWDQGILLNLGLILGFFRPYPGFETRLGHCQILNLGPSVPSPHQDREFRHPDAVEPLVPCDPNTHQSHLPLSSSA